MAEGSAAARQPAPPLGRGAWILLGGNTLNTIGIGIFFPILPLYIGHRGASAALIGAVMTGGIVGYGVAQYPAGWIADNLGRRRVMLASRVLYALFFLAYLLPIPPLALLGVRFLHTFASGFSTPAAMAMLADLTPPERRGRVFGIWQSSTMTGYLIGPAIGGLMAGFGLTTVFVGAFAVCLAAAAATFWVRETRGGAGPFWPTAPHLSGAAPPRLLWALLPIAAAGAAWAWLVGTYDTIWSLYLTQLGGATWEVGLSFSVFALPTALLGGFSGGLADRFGVRPVVAVALVVAGALAIVYGLSQSIPLLIGLSFLEGLFTSGGSPALYAAVSNSVGLELQGRAQGLIQMATQGVSAAGALAGGALFAIHPSFAFFGITGACAFSLCFVPRLGRRPAAAADG
ncbi:MAG: MFS transporter [Candidatus Dormibacteraceae bacterium]